MRFMMFMLPEMPGQADPESPQLPTADAAVTMGKYNDELTKAGVLLSLDGLHPQWEGTRVAFSGGKRTVIDGPFTEAKEAIGGYWLIQVKSKEEAIEWAKRVPRSTATSPSRCARSSTWRSSRSTSRRPSGADRLRVTTSETNRTIDAVWRIESPRLIAGLARIVRDVGLAEDLAQDALVAALEQWPESGVPDNPGAWLMATAKHHAIDRLRRNERLERKVDELGRELEVSQDTSRSDIDVALDALDDDIGDDLLSLIFTACHPVLSTEARVALTLRLLGGLTTTEIARVPRVGADGGATDRACEAHALRGACSVRGPSR